MMKAREFRALTRDDVVKKIAEMEEELFNLRFQAKMGQLANALQLRLVRRNIARAKTIAAEMAKQASVAQPSAATGSVPVQEKAPAKDKAPAKEKKAVKKRAVSKE